MDFKIRAVVVRSVFFPPSLTSATLLTVKVWVESLPAHLADLLRVVVEHVLHELLLAALGIDALQLLLVHRQHLVDAPLVFELETQIKKENELQTIGERF